MTPEQTAKIAALADQADALVEAIYAACEALGGCSCHQRGQCVVCALNGSAEHVGEARYEIENLGRPPHAREPR